MLIVVRHGRTEVNAAGLLLGRADPDLDETGRRQAGAVAEVLTGEEIARVVTSPLRRAQATARAIAECGGRGEPVVDERWIELDYGEFEGRSAAAVPAEVWARWRDDPDFAPPGGESLGALRRRVDEAVEEWSLDPVPTVVVTHVSPVKAVLGWALGVGDQVNWRSFVAPASVTRVDVGPVLRSFNEVGHLAGPPGP